MNVGVFPVIGVSGAHLSGTKHSDGRQTTPPQERFPIGAEERAVEVATLVESIGPIGPIGVVVGVAEASPGAASPARVAHGPK
jgi:hypothetical protein